MMKQFLLAAAMFAFATPASAQVAEIRLGANFHDIDWTGAGSGSDKERSGAINGEIVFEEPEFLKWALTPQPYIGGAVNLGGETSYGGAGLLWRQTFAENFYIDLSLGLVVHDGTIEVDASPLVQSVIDDASVETGFTDAQRAQFATELAEFRNRQQTEIDYGSRVLFREQIAIGYRWSEQWSTHVFVEHLSHGNILVSGRPNEGLDTLGMRASYHF
ncbi:MAG: acyloxyacyl hydrolase [Litorimonas sp.]